MPVSSFFDNECDLDERDRAHRRNSAETGASSSSRRARIIVQLSDSEDEENEEEEGEEEAERRGEEGGRGRERRERGVSGHRAGNNNDNDGDEEENDEEEGEGDGDADDDDNEGEDPNLTRSMLPWWQRKWPRAMLREKESRWRLADHCRSRTQLYHTLLHYKFRLFLKVDRRRHHRSSQHTLLLSTIIHV